MAFLKKKKSMDMSLNFKVRDSREFPWILSVPNSILLVLISQQRSLILTIITTRLHHENISLNSDKNPFWRAEQDGLLLFKIKISVDQVLVVQLFPTLCNCMDCSPLCSSIHGVNKARILKWVAIPISRDLKSFTKCHEDIKIKLT